MTIKTQLWSPDTCECEIEEIWDTEVPNSNQVFYFHNVCTTHELLIKNKPKLSKADFDKKRNDTLTLYEGLLDANKERNLKEHDEHPSNIKKREAIKEMKKDSKFQKHALKTEAKLDNERSGLVNRLDNFKDDMMARAMTGLNSEYSLIAQEVYEKIKEEMRLKAFPNG